MILQRGNLAGLEGACGGKFLYGSFFLFFFFFSLSSFLFAAKFFVTVGFLFFFYKTLALKDSNTIQTTATNPHPWGPSRAGDSGGGGPLGCFVAVFLVSGAGGQVRGPRAGGIVQQFHGEMVTRKDT